MSDFFSKLIEIYKEPPKKAFDFQLSQPVRILKTLSCDTYYIKDLLGVIGTVKSRYVTGLHKENKYEVEFPNGRIETFDETELDKRFIRKR